MPLTVCLPQNRSQSSGSAAPWLEELVDEIVAHGEDRVLEQDIAQWRQDLRKRLQQMQQHPEQGLGFIEEHIRQAALRLQCLLVQKAMQDKANLVEEKCPDCGSPYMVEKWLKAGPVWQCPNPECKYKQTAPQAVA